MIVTSVLLEQLCYDIKHGASDFYGTPGRFIANCDYVLKFWTLSDARVDKLPLTGSSFFFRGSLSVLVIVAECMANEREF